MLFVFPQKCFRHDKKKDVIYEIVTMKRKEIQNKSEEERYMKEERDKMALEMYESWLVSTITCGTSDEWH